MINLVWSICEHYCGCLVGIYRKSSGDHIVLNVYQIIVKRLLLLLLNSLSGYY